MEEIVDLMPRLYVKPLKVWGRISPKGVSTCEFSSDLYPISCRAPRFRGGHCRNTKNASF